MAITLNLLQTYISDGNMSTSPESYKEKLSLEKIEKIFLDKRIALGKSHGFDGHFMYMASQNDKKGSYKIIDEEFVRDNPNGWAKIDEDILLVSSKTPGVVIGHSINDYPVVTLSDPKKKVCAIANCGGEMINLKMPIMEVEAIRSAYDSKKNNLVAFISACAGDDLEVSSYPDWATDEEVWKDSIVPVGKSYHINIRKAIIEQLYRGGIKTVIVNPSNTITSPLFYSDSASSKGDVKKKGYNFAGAYYK